MQVSLVTLATGTSGWTTAATPSLSLPQPLDGVSLISEVEEDINDHQPLWPTIVSASAALPTLTDSRPSRSTTRSLSLLSSAGCSVLASSATSELSTRSSVLVTVSFTFWSA